MFFVMKKLLPIFALSFLLLCGCNTIKDMCTTSDCLPEDWEQEIETETETEINYWLEDAVVNYIETNFDCKDWSKLFVNYAELTLPNLSNVCSCVKYNELHQKKPKANINMLIILFFLNIYPVPRVILYTKFT